jgi:hypothetical protein
VAVQVAYAVEPLTTGALGQVSETTGAAASTEPVKEPADETRPTLSVAVPVAVNAPGVVMVHGPVTEATPLPAEPSCRLGSPLPVKLTVTESFHQPPSPAYSGARSAEPVGTLGAPPYDGSTTEEPMTNGGEPGRRGIRAGRAA